MKDIRDIRFLIPSIFILMLVGVVIGIAAWSAPTADVDVKVQVTPTYSVSVTDAAINYGALALSGTKDTNLLSPDDTQTATNNGSTTEKLNIMGSNSTPDAWQLSATGAQGNNIYFHKFATDGGTAWNNLATSGYSVMRASIAKDATQGFDLYIGVPSTTAATATQDVDVTVQATSL